MTSATAEAPAGEAAHDLRARVTEAAARNTAFARLRELAWRASYLEGARFMSRVRRNWQRFRNPRADIRFLGDVFCGPGFQVHAPWGGTLIIGHGTELRRNTLFYLSGPEARIVVGERCYFTYDVIISCGRSIEIGDRVGIGQGGFVVDGSHRYRDHTAEFLEQGFDYRPIHIGDDAQIHSKCTIIHDVGERAIIGSNALVCKPVPPFTVSGGVPAKVIDRYGPGDA